MKLLIKKPTKEERYKLITPYYIVDENGRELFFRNFVIYLDRSNESSDRRDMARHIRGLRRNQYRYFAFHYVREDLFEFLEYMRENNYTLGIGGEMFDFTDRDYVDFHGSVMERSGSFFYRIYDRETFERLIREMKTIKREYKWKREPKKQLNP